VAQYSARVIRSRQWGKPETQGARMPDAELDPSHIIEVGAGFRPSKTLLSTVELDQFSHLLYWAVSTFPTYRAWSYPRRRTTCSHAVSTSTTSGRRSIAAGRNSPAWRPAPAHGRTGLHSTLACSTANNGEVAGKE
jgi:hypothetical protein